MLQTPSCCAISRQPAPGRLYITRLFTLLLPFLRPWVVGFHERCTWSKPPQERTGSGLLSEVIPTGFTCCTSSGVMVQPNDL